MKHCRKITDGIFLIILILLATDCSRNPILEHHNLHNAEIQDKPRNAVNNSQSSLDDNKLVKEIIRVKKDMVVFFTITQKEFDSYDAKTQEGVTEVLSDFYTYDERARKILIKYGLNPEYTVSKELLFQYSNGHVEKVFIDSTKHIVGTIFVGKAKKPKIYYGIMFDDQICKMASEYFGIKIEYP